MTISAQAGPIVVYGQNPAQAGTNYQPDYNGDLAPSAFAGGIMLLDPRYGFRAPLQAGSLAAIGIANCAEYLLIDQAPATAAVANIGAAANVTSGTAMTLVTTTGAGVTVSAAALTIPQSGVVLPVGTRFLDGAPAMIAYGQNGAVATIDPRTMLSRVVSITGSASATGGNMTVRGYDVYGFAVTETIAATSGATTTFGKKGFKAVTSVTPAFTDAHNYSVGTGDVFEFPLLVSVFKYAEMAWNNAVITANTGFLAADTTSPATAVTGSVRGTYAVQSASDGTKRLQVSVLVPPQNSATANGATSLFGVTQFSG